MMMEAALCVLAITQIVLAAGQFVIDRKLRHLEEVLLEERERR